MTSARGALPRRPQAVVFDMDGVLVDSEPLWHEAEIEAFARCGVTLTKADCQETTGVRIDLVVQHWRRRFPAALARADDDVIVDDVVRGVVARVAARGAPMTGLADAIAAVRALGVPVGLASSSPPTIIAAVLDRLGIASLFRDVRSAWKLPRPKPDPAVYLDACAALGVSPADALAIEDSESGLRAALRAGMMVVAIPDPASRPPPSAAEADVVIADLTGLRAALERSCAPA